MFKIKLLILLLISFFLFSCTENKIQNFNNKYSLDYISGEYDGLVLKNILTSYLLSFDLYDNNSTLQIKSSISHSPTLYITNIDNTSDRVNIESSINVKIVNQKNECEVYSFDKTLSQFYIFADSDKFVSNDKAQEKIKRENTETLVKSFINNLYITEQKCSSKILKIREKYY